MDRRKKFFQQYSDKIGTARALRTKITPEIAIAYIRSHNQLLLSEPTARVIIGRTWLRSATVAAHVAGVPDDHGNRHVAGAPEPRFANGEVGEDYTGAPGYILVDTNVLSDLGSADYCETVKYISLTVSLYPWSWSTYIDTVYAPGYAEL